VPKSRPEGAAADGKATIDLLDRWREGDDAALEPLVERLYSDLRRLARAQLARERAGHTLEPTALVNEVFLRLGSYREISWQGRAHFLAVASRAMRRVLVDHARRRHAAKRGAAPVRVTLTDVASPQRSSETELIALNAVLEDLERKDPRQCRVVEMRYFGGLSYEEIAAVLGVAQPTVKRDWRVARLWLRRALA
jgi:RNA polymerase sigma factor (TIGR02999 family)